jgi:hypothetical protein
LKVIWVLENIIGDTKFYSKFDTLLLLSSVRLWKRNNPKDYCVLYCDWLTKKFINALDVEWFWDDIIEFTPTTNIDKRVFWASSKLEVLSLQTEPVLLLDNDTIVYKNLNEYIDWDTHWVFNLEMGAGYYPTYYDEYVQRLSIKKRWKPEAVNVSFLNLPNPTFTKEYADLSLKFMSEFTEMGVENSNYLIFSEQLLLKDLLDTKQIPYKSIVSNYEISVNRDWGKEHDMGIWNKDQYMQYIRHYGAYKKKIKEKNLQKEYNFELKSLFFSINFRNFHLTDFLDSNEYSK